MITGAYRFDQHKGIKSAKTTVDWKIRSKTFKAEHHACIILPQSNRLQRELLNQYWFNKCNQRVTWVATCDWSAHQSEVVQQHVCLYAVHIVPLTAVIHPPRSYTKRCCSMCRNASHGLHFCASPPGPRCAVHLPTPNCASTQPNCSSSCPIHPVLNAWGTVCTICPTTPDCLSSTQHARQS